MDISGNTVISTFAGCGGSSLGYKWAGFTELLAIDFDKNAVETFKLNFDCPIWMRDIKEVTGKEILDFCHIKQGELDVLDGSPPCQGFSTAGKRQVSDSRNDLFKEFVRLIIELQPKVFVMENVSGMIKGIMKGRFNEILKDLKATGYNVKCKLMNAMWYNVPQSRERLFFIGVRDDLGKEPTFPKPSDKVITVKEALKDIIKEQRTLPGKKILNLLLKSGIGCIGYNNYAFNHFKIGNNEVCRAITKKPQLYLDNGYLTLNELKRLSTFPDNYIFTDWWNGWLRIGNSVMPKMMQAIAETIKTEILNA